MVTAQAAKGLSHGLEKAAGVDGILTGRPLASAHRERSMAYLLGLLGAAAPIVLNAAIIVAIARRTAAN